MSVYAANNPVSREEAGTYEAQEQRDFGRLPEFLTNLSPIGETLAAFETENSLLEAEIAARNAQLSVASAGEGLSLWEADYALPGDGDLFTRRGRVLAALSGREQVLTRDYLAELAVTVGGADRGEVIEWPAEYRVALCAVFEGREEGDVTALREAVERLKPAHLAVEVSSRSSLLGVLTHYTALAGKAHLMLCGQMES